MSVDVKKEFISAVISSLRIDGNPFNIGLIDEYITGIRPDQYRDFYSDLFGNDHDYLNGIDRVCKVSERYKNNVKRELRRDADEIAGSLLGLDILFQRTFKTSDYGDKIEGEELDLNRIKPPLKETHVNIICEMFGGVKKGVLEASKNSMIAENIYSFLTDRYFGKKREGKSALSIITGLAENKRALPRPTGKYQW
jgi:hypothetical protein